MKKIINRAFCLVLLTLAILITFTGLVSAEELSNQYVPYYITATSPSYAVENFEIYPKSLMPGESGIVTFTLKNTGTNFLPIDRVLIKDSDGIDSIETLYRNPIGGVGAGDTIDISLPITAKSKTGTFYPVLYVDFNYDAYTSYYYTYLKYPFAVIVDDVEPLISVTSRPDYFEPDTTNTVSFSIGNQRINTIEAVSISASGDGVSAREGFSYIGTINAGAVGNGSLTIITTDESEEVVIDVTYRNGANWHTESLILPLEAGISKTGAELVVNNVEIKNGEKFYTITGDVNNAGLTTAKGLVVTTEGAVKTGTYPSFVVGSLDTDGLSEFEVTFKNPENNSVTVVFNYKDINGNVFTQKEKVTLSDTVSTNTQASGSNSTAATIIVVIVILAVLACGFIAWKKGKIFARK
ncbi:MAG: hypothetical protein Q4Q53_02090 [Methanocorpusculum sp.]|nr:hypothetical protein [Methanocorpusculum sp.]